MILRELTSFRNPTTGSIPNHVKFAANAGDCCIFDRETAAAKYCFRRSPWQSLRGHLLLPVFRSSYVAGCSTVATWHTAQPNRSQLERWNTIQGYHSAALRGGKGGTPTGGMMGDGMLERLAAAGQLTASKRHVLGMAVEE